MVITLFAAAVLGEAAAPGMPTTTDAFPLEVSANRRYFVDQDRKPFRINAEAAWLVSVQSTPAEVDAYLADRKSKGFNSIIVMGMVHPGEYSKVAPQAPKNKAGDAPHATVGDFSSAPTEAYWAHIDTIIDKAKAQGMAVIFAYTYLGYAGGDQGWWQEINRPVNTQEVCFNWGVWLGTRYKSRTNIIWYTLGDYSPPAGSEGSKRTHKIVEGIKSTCPWALFGGEPSNPDNLSTDVTDFRDVLDMNSFYGYGPNQNGLSFLAADRAWTYAPTMPAWVGEPNYYQEPYGGAGDRVTVRRQVWYSVLGGGLAGDNTGSHNIWSWTNVKGDLDSGYSTDRKSLFALFDSMPWHELMPSGVGGGRLGKNLIAGNNPDDATHIAAAATPSGTWLVAYTPGTSPFSVDMTALGGPVRARWYDQTSGAYTTIAAPIDPTGTHAFTTPGKNSDGQLDWVLVLDRTVAGANGGQDGGTGSPDVAPTSPDGLSTPPRPSPDSSSARPDERDTTAPDVATDVTAAIGPDGGSPSTRAKGSGCGIAGPSKRGLAVLLLVILIPLVLVFTRDRSRRRDQPF